MPTAFDKDGEFFYFFKNAEKKKFKVDVFNRKIVDESYFINDQTFLVMSTKENSEQFGLSLTKKGML